MCCPFPFTIILDQLKIKVRGVAQKLDAAEAEKAAMQGELSKLRRWYKEGGEVKVGTATIRKPIPESECLYTRLGRCCKVY